MTQKTPLSIDELEAMLSVQDGLDDALEAYILRASVTELDQFLESVGIDPATAQVRALASISEAARRLDATSTASENAQPSPLPVTAQSENITSDPTDKPGVQTKSKKVLRGLDALANSPIRTVPFRAKIAADQAVPPAKAPAGSPRKGQSGNGRMQQYELALGFAKQGSQQHDRPEPDDNFIDTVEIGGRQFLAYRDRTPAGEVLLVGAFEPSWTCLEAGQSRWSIRPTERDDTRRCVGLGRKLFKRLLAAHASGEARLQFGATSHDQT